VARYSDAGQCLECGGFGERVLVPQDERRVFYGRDGRSERLIPNPWRVGHDAFHEGMIPRTEVERMSNVLWCDPGSHAFKAGEPGSQSFVGTTVDVDGNSVSQKMDACAEHSFSASGPRRAIRDANPLEHENGEGTA